MSALASILDYASAHVPRYRGLPGELGKFPVLDKATARADIAAHISDALGPQKAALVEFLRDENRPCGVNEEAAFGNHIIIEETSGSSGIPFRTTKTLEERAGLSFAIWQYRRKFDPQCSSKSFYPIFHRPGNVPAIGKARDFTSAGVDDLYKKLTDAGMRWVHSGPDVLRRHAELISKDMAKNKSVCFAENTSVSLRENDWNFIESNLNVTLLDQYGCREAWAIGVRHKAEYFDVLAENVVVELLDHDHKPISELNRQGRIVVTGLHQRIFPIIRYDTGDLGSWAKEPIGQHLRLSNYRQHNVLRFQPQEVDGNELFRKILGHAYRLTGYVPLRYVQIRQVETRKFVLAVSKSPKAGKICDAITGICKSHECFHPDVRFDFLELSDDEIEREIQQKASLFTTKHLCF